MAKPIVGILSMQRVINYGSFLQAYALKQLLLKNGAGEVYFVDIIPGRILIDNHSARRGKYFRYVHKLLDLFKSGNIISGLKTFKFNRALDKSIRSSWPMLGLNSIFSGTFDQIIIGSDEVFNCIQGVSWGYTPQLFGDIPTTTARKVFSYAGSFGYTTLAKLKLYSVDSEVAENLNKLSAISVRDENSASIVKTLTGKTPYIHIDPVLAYGYRQEIADYKDRPIQIPYMIIYSYQDRINDKEEVQAITEYAKRNGLKLISIFCRYDWCDEAILPENPIEVLCWFKFAECVVTDTFHGTIFSIITESNFVSLLRPSNQNKLQYLLEILNLHDREATPSLLNQILATVPDYSNCNSILDKKRQDTNTYLKKYLG